MEPRIELKAQCIKLRLEQRLSIKEIHKITQASTSSLSLWLKSYPLTAEELALRQKLRDRSGKGINGGRPENDWWRAKQESSLHKLIGADNLTAERKGKIAEAAIRLRLLVIGLDTFNPCFEGQKVDCIVMHERTLKPVKVQIRHVKKNEHGLPSISLKCSNGRLKYKRYDQKDFDILIGFDTFTDTSHIITHKEIMHLSDCVSLKPEYEDAWHKILDFTNDEPKKEKIKRIITYRLKE